MGFSSWLDTAVLSTESAKLAQTKKMVVAHITELSQRRDILSGEVVAFDRLVAQLEQTRRDRLAELAVLDRKASIHREEVAQLQADLKNLTDAIAVQRNHTEKLATEATTLEQHIAALEHHHATLLATTPTLEATQAQAQDDAIAQARQDLARTVAATEAAKEQLEAAQSDREKLRQDAIAEIESEIEIKWRRFQLEMDVAIQAVEREKFEAVKAIQSDEMAVVERWSADIVAPIQTELDAAHVEIARLARLLAAKDGASLEWQLEQVRSLLVRTLEDGSTRPIHLRIAGESESGKSHLVNQLITTGLPALGLDADIELYDPYPSDTTWKIAPTIADDPDAIAARLVELKEICQNADAVKRQRPLIVVVDECDALILQFKTTVTEALKTLLKRGRHCNIILWMLGQNANVKALGWDWSDIKNAGAIYLNQCGYEYLKNGMKGRNCTSVQGELDAIASRYPYYALIHPKGKPRPYAVAVPKVLFAVAQDATEAQPAAKAVAKAVAAKAPCPNCPKCGSPQTKWNGGPQALSGARRIVCKNCGKSSTVSG